MNKRNCPVCDHNETVVIMRFTPELLSEVNETYRLEVLREAVNGKEEFLTYSKCRNCGMVYCENVWDDEHVPTHATIRTYIKNLRKMFLKEYFDNIKGEGYRFNIL